MDYFELVVQIVDSFGEVRWETEVPDFLNADASQPSRIVVIRRPRLRSVIVADQTLRPWPPTEAQMQGR